MLTLSFSWTHQVKSTSGHEQHPKGTGLGPAVDTNGSGCSRPLLDDRVYTHVWREEVIKAHATKNMTHHGKEHTGIFCALL